MSTPTVLILDLPPKTFIGIDLVSFNSSPNFHGIINLPPGCHFLYTGTDASLSIRHGRWLNINPQTTGPQRQYVYVFRWNWDHEALESLGAGSHYDVDDADAYSAAVESIPSLQGRGLVDFVALQDASSNLQSRTSTTSSSLKRTSQYLNGEDDDRDNDGDGNGERNGNGGADDAEDAFAWPSLSSHITTHTLTRIMAPIDALQSSVTLSRSWTISSISTSPQDHETIPGLDAREANPVLQDAGASTLHFVDINLKQTWPNDSVGRDRTVKARDKSWYLGHLIDDLSSSSRAITLNGPSASAFPATVPNSATRQKSARELLAELQFCFLMVLTLANYSALEQWKRILTVVLGSRTALSEIEPYFSEAVRVLRVQLGRVEDVEGGLFEMADEIGSQWLRQLLKTFRSNVNETLGHSEAGEEVKGALGELERWLRDKYGWNDEGNILKKGMIDLEDGERVEVQMDGFDEEEESGEYAPVIVQM